MTESELEFTKTCSTDLLVVAVVVYLLSCVSFVAPLTVAHQASLSIGFSRHEYGSGLPFPSPGDLPEPGLEPTSSALAGGSLLLSHQGSLL